MATSFRPHVQATNDENAYHGIGVREQMRLPQTVPDSAIFDSLTKMALRGAAEKGKAVAPL
jgi:hypothetical protein